MESVSIFEESYKELQSLSKKITSSNTSSLTINFENLDGETKSAILLALNDVIRKRKAAIVGLFGSSVK